MTDSSAADATVPAERATKGFVHLHVHTEYSKQDGISRLGDLVEFVKSDGQTAVAMTDHGNMGGAWKFVQACKKAGVKPILGLEAYMALVPDGSDPDQPALDWDDPAVRFAKTSEMGMDAESGKVKRNTNNHLTLLVRNEAGWRNLCAITNAAEESFYHKPLIDYALLKQHSGGLIVLTGCLGGPVASHVAAARLALRQVEQSDNPTETERAAARAEYDNRMAKARTNLERLIECVGAENVYVEVMEHGLEAEGKDHIVALAGLAKEYGLKVVATNDSHYVHCDHADAHDSWLVNGERARGNKTITKDDPDRWRFNGEGYWMRTEAEMRALYPKARTWQEACDNTVDLAARIDDDVIPFKPLRLPKFPVPADAVAEWEAGTPATFTDINGVEHPARRVGKRAYRSASAYYLHQLVRKGADDRYGGVKSDLARSLGLAKRLNFEFDVITGMGLEDYFLIVWDVLAWARSDRGLPTAEHPDGAPGGKKPILVGPGRGSAAGSAISYCLWIVMVEPLANGLLFERFLDVARVGMPDIDVDFEAARRDEVYTYLAAKYGAEYIARIGAFQVAKTKRAIKDAARVLDLVPIGEKLASLVPVHQGSPQQFPTIFEEVIDKETGRPKPNPEASEFRDLVASDPDAARVVELARAFENVVAGESIHAAGVIISDEPLTNLIPLRLMRDKKTGRPTGVPIALWDGKDVDSFGMLKLDALSLSNLDIVAAARDNIEAVTGEYVDPDGLPDPDTVGDERVEKAFQLLRDGKTSGIFQLESSGITELCEAIAPTQFADLSALVALYRPGPMAAGMHMLYADRKNGRAPIDYDYLTTDPAERAVIEGVLGETFGTCIAEGERIYSATRGLMVPIETVQVGEIVQGVDESGRHVLAPVTAHINNGLRDTVSIEFAGGRSIRLTPDHRLLTASGWKKAADLAPTDSVAAPWRLLTADEPHDVRVPERDLAEAALMGYLLGDGSLTESTNVYFINSDPSLLAAVEDLARTAFPGTQVTRMKDGPRGVGRVKLSNPARGGRGGAPEGALLAWLRQHGLKAPRSVQPSFGAHSRAKFIPSRWLKRTDATALALIGALWDCDGRIGVDRRGCTQAVFKTISPLLADDLRHLLLRFGMTTALTRHPYDNPKRGTTEVAHHIAVHQVERFVELVVPYMRSKEKIAAADARRPARHRTRHGSSVPGRDVRTIKHRVGMPWKKWCRENGFGASDPTRSQWLGAELIQDLSVLTRDPELTRLAGSQWLRVKSIAPAGRTQVYDLTVDGVHNFVAEGVVVHNCAYQESLMSLAEVVAGFTADEKNRLRKAFSKKDRPAMEALKEVFISQGQQEMTLADGTRKIAFAKSTLEALWVTFDGSAEYLFNKSHSAAYGYLAYVTAYLKANWPTEYAAGILSVVDKAEKRLATLFALRDDGITVLAPDVNASRTGTAPDPKDPTAVRLGLAEIRDVGNNGHWIVHERERGGDFTSVADLMRRVKVPDKNGDLTAKLPVTAVEGLVEAGAFDSLGYPRLGLMVALRAISGGADIDVPDMEWSPLERSTRQRARLGVALGEHPMRAYVDTLRRYLLNPVEDRWGNVFGGKPVPLHMIAPGTRETVITLGVLTSWSERITRKGSRMANFSIEGTQAAIDGTAFNDAITSMRKVGRDVAVGDIVAVAGQMKTRTVTNLTVNDDGEEVEETREVSELIASHIEVVDVDTTADLNLPEVPPDRKVDLASVINLAEKRAEKVAAEKAAAKKKPKPKNAPSPAASDDGDVTDFDFDTATADRAPIVDIPAPRTDPPAASPEMVTPGAWTGVRLYDMNFSFQPEFAYTEGGDYDENANPLLLERGTGRNRWPTPVAGEHEQERAYKYIGGCRCTCGACKRCAGHDPERGSVCASTANGKQKGRESGCGCKHNCAERLAYTDKLALIVFAERSTVTDAKKWVSMIDPNHPAWTPLKDDDALVPGWFEAPLAALRPSAASSPDSIDATDPVVEDVTDFDEFDDDVDFRVGA